MPTAVKDWLIGEGYDASKIVVIRNGVDLTRFAGPARPGADPPRARPAAGTPLVAVVSRLTRLKGLENLLEAAAMLKPSISRRPLSHRRRNEPDGACRTSDELKQLADRLGVGDRVIFTGRRSDVPALLSGVDVSVMPSLNEALSNVLLESMAAGAPTVATRVGGTPEALVDEQTGLLVAPGDSRALADAVGALLDDPIAGAAGSDRRRAQLIEDRFSVERMVQSTEELYHGASGAQAAHAAPEDRVMLAPPQTARLDDARGRQPRQDAVRASTSVSDYDRVRRSRGRVERRGGTRATSRIRSSGTSGCARGGTPSARPARGCTSRSCRAQRPSHRDRALHARDGADVRGSGAARAVHSQRSHAAHRHHRR